MQTLPHQCACPACRAPGPSPTKDYHAQVNLFLSTLTEAQRRLFAGLEAERLGQDGVEQLALITGMSTTAIGMGRKALEQAAQPQVYAAKKAGQVKEDPRYYKCRPLPPGYRL